MRGGVNRHARLLQPGSEPTEHFLNELRESGLVFERSIELALIIRDWSELDDPTLKRFLSVYPKARILEIHSRKISIYWRGICFRSGFLACGSISSSPFNRSLWILRLHRRRSRYGDKAFAAYN